MADPVSATLAAAPALISTVGAVAGIGSTIAGGRTAVKGDIQQGLATLKQNYYQAGVADLNAKIAKQNADYAINQGEQESIIKGIAGGEQLGAIRAAQSSSGLDVNTGSAPRVIAGQKRSIDQDLMQIRSNAAKVAYDFDVQSVGFEQQAGLYRMAGTNAMDAAEIKAQSSIIGTAASVASKWTQASQTGLFSLGGSGGSGSQASGGEGFDSASFGGI